MLDIRSSVICDDIRQEVGGKMILIGSYASVSLPFLPFKFSTFGVYIEVVPEKLQYARARIAIFDPHGQLVKVAEGPYVFNLAGIPAIAWAKFGDVTFGVPGEHRIYLELDSPPDLVKAFHVQQIGALPGT